MWHLTVLCILIFLSCISEVIFSTFEGIIQLAESILGLIVVCNTGDLMLIFCVLSRTSKFYVSFSHLYVSVKSLCIGHKLCILMKLYWLWSISFWYYSLKPSSETLLCKDFHQSCIFNCMSYHCVVKHQILHYCLWCINFLV